jgi:competence protein ComEC
MIDGGSSSAGEVGGTVLLPFLRAEGVRRIDAMILTHPDIDHYSGMLELLEGAEGPIPEREDGTWILPNGLEVGTLLLPDLDSRLRTEGYRLLEETAARKRIPVRYLARGDTLSAGDLQLTCLHPEPGGMYESTNAGSTVLLAEYGDFSCLLTGDLERDGEEQCLAFIRNSADLLRKASRLTCLKTAHHGSRFATGEAWLSVIDAQLAVISCGRDNLYGHPAPETVRRLREDGSGILTTAELGCVRLRTDGETVGIVFGNTNWYH